MVRKKFRFIFWFEVSIVGWNQGEQGVEVLISHEMGEALFDHLKHDLD